MRPAWIIEEAKPGDAPGIVAVQKEGWMMTYPDPAVGITVEDIAAVDFDSPKKLASWEDTIKNHGESKHMLVARQGLTIIGFCVGEKKDAMNEIRAIYVLQKFHGKNISKALMDAALAWLGTEKDICVLVFAHNKRAIEFYRKCGFVESGKTGLHPINGKPIPNVEMVRKANS